MASLTDDLGNLLTDDLGEQLTDDEGPDPSDPTTYPGQRGWRLATKADNPQRCWRNLDGTQ